MVLDLLANVESFTPGTRVSAVKDNVQEEIAACGGWVGSMFVYLYILTTVRPKPGPQGTSEQSRRRIAGALSSEVGLLILTVNDQYSFRIEVGPSYLYSTFDR